MPRKLSVVPRTPDPAIARLVDEYLTSCRARGLSPKTTSDEGGYGYPLKGEFLPFVAQQGIREPAHLTTQLLDRFTTQLLDHGGKRGPLSTHTVHSYARAVNGFLKWATSQGAPAVRAQLPRLPKKLVEVLDRKEIQALEDAAETERDRLIVRIMADTGLRRGELTRLRVRDVESGRGQSFLRVVAGKGERDRLVPIPGLHTRIQRFIQHRPKDARSDRLFLSRRGGAPLTTSGVHQVIRILALKVELGKPVHPHTLRHSYATEMLRQGMNPVQLMDILGHKSLAMITNTYAHLTPSDSYDAMARVIEKTR